MKKVEERLLEVEKEMAEAKGKAQATHRWAGIFGVAVLAGLGITSYVQIPKLVNELVNETAAGEAAAEILRLRQEAAGNAQKIRLALDDAKRVSPIRWVTVKDSGAGDDDAPNIDEAQALHCFFDRTEVDRQLDDWTDWHERRVLVANLDTGDVSSGIIFRGNPKFPALRAHVRFGPPLLLRENEAYIFFEPSTLPKRQSIWEVGTTCMIGIVAPGGY